MCTSLGTIIPPIKIDLGDCPMLGHRVFFPLYQTHRYSSIVWICHNFLDQFTLDEHLACFQPLVILTRAIRNNTLSGIFARISDEFQEVELLS